MLDLGKTREKIDAVDRQILNLFEERMMLTQEVAAYKTKTGKKVFDKERENSKLKTLQSLVTNDYNRHPVKELFTQIMSMSRKMQYTLIPTYSSDLSFDSVSELPLQPDDSIVYFGEKGSYTQQAMEVFFKGKEYQSFNAPVFKDVMEMVRNNQAVYGVIPIENSSTGGILDTYDLLMQYKNYIVGECIIQIDHALLGLPDAKLNDIRTVYSHPQGIMQCSCYFEEHKDIQTVEYFSTAAAAKKVLEDKDPSQGAIASLRAADEYGLKVLQKHLNFERSNATRFIIISNRKMYCDAANKVSICFELPHESGSLYNILSHFIFNNLNMTKIESRPIAGRPWEYRFFADFEGSLTDSGVKNAINGIKEEAASLRILGNYTTL